MLLYNLVRGVSYALTVTAANTWDFNENTIVGAIFMMD